MSHFPVLVMLPKEPEHAVEMDDMLNQVLQRYDESREVPPYIKETRQQTIDRQREEIRKYRDTEYALYTRDTDAYFQRDRNPGHLKYISEEFPNEILPLLTAPDEAVFAYATRYEDNSDRDGDGALWVTYNPEAKWDWWVIGGRWPYALYTHRAGERVNFGLVKDIDWETTKPMFAVITPDGEWHEKGHMGWWGAVLDPKDKDTWEQEFKSYVEASPFAYCVVIDAHI